MHNVQVSLASYPRDPRKCTNVATIRELRVANHEVRILQAAGLHRQIQLAVVDQSIHPHNVSYSAHSLASILTAIDCSVK